jgi:ribosome-associated protein
VPAGDGDTGIDSSRRSMAPIVRQEEVEFSAMRAQGPGGQNVNKVSSAIHLRFDIRRSSLPPAVKEKLLALPGRRVSKEGVLVLKAQSARSQEENKAQAMARLQKLVAEAAEVQAERRPTKPTFGSKQRRLKSKALRAEVKATRGKVQE